MTKQDNRGFAPSIADIEFEQLFTWWRENYAFGEVEAKWLALYQYTGGNAFGLIDINGRTIFAPRGEC